ncbi:MAG: LamG domain-containing protein [bacterium]|nr:LamG domain-containing protein [bacterium]
MSKFLKQLLFISLGIAILVAGGLVIYSATPSGKLKINPILGHDLNAKNLYGASGGNVLNVTTEDFSVSAWVNFPVGNVQSQVIMLKTQSSYASGAGYKFYYTSTNLLDIRINDGTDDYLVYFSVNINDGKWHHLAATIDRDNANNCLLYIDGVVKAVSRTGTLANIDSITNTDNFTVAKDTNGNVYLNGSIKDTKISIGTVWTAAQILYQAQHPFDYTANAGTLTDYWRLDEGSGTTLYGLVNNLTLSNVLAWTTQPKIKMVNQENATTTSNNPVGWWKMDEGTASSSYDSSGNGNTGTLTGGVQWTTGKLGKGLSFDGVNDYVSVGDPASGVLDFGISNFSIGTWVKTSSVQAIKTIIYKGATSAANKGYWIYINATGVVIANIADGTNRPTAVSTSGWNNNQWHYVIVVFNRAGNSQVYMDGVANGTPASLAPIAGNTIDNAFSFRIGGTSGANASADGIIDDVRIYNRALSAGEVGQMYNSTKDGYLGKIKVSTGLVGYWKLDDNNTLTSVIDYSGKGNTGTAYSGTATSTSVLSTSTAMVGRAMGFDGVNDWVGSTYSSNLKLGNNGTVSLWVKPISLPSGTHILVSYGGSGYISGYLVSQNGSDLYVYWITAGSNMYVASVLQLNTWQHIAFTNKDGAMTLYYNGVNIKTGNSGGTLTADWSTYIGGGYSTWYFNGLIDEVKIWNYARSAEQIGQDYVRGVKGLP